MRLLIVASLLVYAGCSGSSEPADPSSGKVVSPLGGGAPVGPPPVGPEGAVNPGLASVTAGPVPVATWIGEGATTTLTAQVKGLTLNEAGETPRIRLDFMVKGDTGRYRIKAQAEVVGPQVSVQVPATYADPVWIFAWTDANGNGPESTDLVCLLADPITLSGRPVDVTLDFVTGVEPPNVSEGGPAVEGQDAAGLEAPPPGAAAPQAEGDRPPLAEGAPPAGGVGAPSGTPPTTGQAGSPTTVGGKPAPGPDGAAPTIVGPPAGAAESSAPSSPPSSPPPLPK